MKNTIYDTIIIGAGPAGLSAGVYASRYMMKYLVIAKELGGTMTNAHKVENYPGITSVSGTELAQKMQAQMKELGGELLTGEVKRISKNSAGVFEITTETAAGDQNETTFKSHTLILAIGMRRRKLQIPGEKEFLGKGVSYCAVCDAAFFKDKTTVVVGGANAATMAAIQLTEYAKQVYLIYRGPALKGEPAWNQKVLDNPKIEVIFNTNVTEIIGENLVTKVKLSQPYQEKETLATDGVFIEIGHVPSASLAKRLGLELTEEGFIKTQPNGKTNVEGVLAAGDITTGSGEFRQIVTAVGEGAIAAKTAFDLKAEREASKKDIDYA